MIRNFIFILLCGYFSAPAFGVVRQTPVRKPRLAPSYEHAAENQKPRRFFQNIYFNVGNHTQFVGGVQNDDSGGLRQVAFAPVVGAGLTVPSYYGFNLYPEFNWVLPKLIEDSNIIVNTLQFRFDVGYDVFRYLRLKVGTSIMHQNQHGRGGNSTQRNGNATSTFFYPDENRSSFNNTLDVGFELTFTQNWSIRHQVYVYSIFLAEKRQTSHTFFITYYWNQ